MSECERSEARRATRIPKREAWVGLLAACTKCSSTHLHAERPEGEAWPWNTIDHSSTAYIIHYPIFFYSDILYSIHIFSIILIFINQIFHFLFFNNMQYIPVLRTSFLRWRDSCVRILARSVTTQILIILIFYLPSF